MTNPQKSDDEKQRDEILRRMLKTPPKPHKGKGDEPKPVAPQSSQKDPQDFSGGSQDGRDAKEAGR